jgi:hypothetical protein
MISRARIEIISILWNKFGNDLSIIIINQKLLLFLLFIILYLLLCLLVERLLAHNQIR